jgi:DNA-binding NarL/FixJ family response regulator
VRVVVADDSLLIREGIARVLEDAGLEVCAQAGDADELLRAVESTRPDVAVVDIRMPPTHTTEGLEAATTIRQRHSDTAVLVLSQYVDADYALALVRDTASACGYLLKERITRSGELVDALERLDRGETVIDPKLVEELIDRGGAPAPLEELSPRERHVLALMAEGLTDRGIAEQLWLSPKTVETHVRHILQKLGLTESRARNRRVEAVLAYLRA